MNYVRLWLVTSCAPTLCLYLRCANKRKTIAPFDACGLFRFMDGACSLRFFVATFRGQQRWVRIAAMLESRTAAECKARYRKLSKGIKVRKQERASEQQVADRDTCSVDNEPDTEALAAKADRLAHMQAGVGQCVAAVDTATMSDRAPSANEDATSGGNNDAKDLKMSTVAGAVTKADKVVDNADSNQPPKKLKPSERRALKKAEKAARLEARARRRAAAAAADATRSSDEEESGSVGAGSDATAGALGWGVIEL